MNRTPSTSATRFLRERGIAFTEHLYRYEERGGTALSSRELGVDEHVVVKTLVMETESGDARVVLMHGDAQVSTKALARLIGRKLVRPCVPDVAEKHSGYQVGGTSPFGLRKALPVYMERSIQDLPRIYINGGSRGFLVCLDPKDAASALGATLVDVAIAIASKDTP